LGTGQLNNGYSSVAINPYDEIDLLLLLFYVNNATKYSETL